MKGEERVRFKVQLIQDDASNQENQNSDSFSQEICFRNGDLNKSFMIPYDLPVDLISQNLPSKAERHKLETVLEVINLIQKNN